MLISISSMGSVRLYESLGGKTPVEHALIKVDGKNKWIALIQNTPHTLF